VSVLNIPELALPTKFSFVWSSKQGPRNLKQPSLIARWRSRRSGLFTSLMSAPGIDDALKAMGGPGGPLAGLDLSDPVVRAEAEKVWGMLNNMSENSPKEYKKFLKKNLRDGAREAEKEALEKKRDSARRKGATLFVTTLEDRTQSSSGSSTSKASGGSTRAVAVCLWRTPGLRPPKGPRGLPFTGEENDYTECLFPLRLPKPSPRILVGQADAQKKKEEFDVATSDGAAVAYDVEMHPKIVDCAAMNLNFRGFIVEVIFQWIEYVHGTMLNRTGRKVRVRKEDLERSRSVLNLGLDYEVEEYDGRQDGTHPRLGTIVNVFSHNASSRGRSQGEGLVAQSLEEDISSEDDDNELALDHLHEKIGQSSKSDPDKVLIQELGNTSPQNTLESLEVLD